MDYETALRFIEDCSKHGVKLGLERIGRILWHLGEPQRQFLSIHIAGTNGKGSTAALYDGVLQEAGYKTGRYTSPHLSSYRERFMVDGRMISQSELARIVSELQPAIAAVLREGLGEPTEFEVGTALAFQFFAKEQVDLAVVEVGMGGRWDATNILQPLLTIITRLALDHQEYLGKSLTEIATEKAGIIKERVPLVIGDQDPKIEALLSKIAAERDAPVHYAKDLPVHDLRISEDGTEFQTAVAGYGPLALKLRLLGRHQVQNSLNLLAGLDFLAGSGFPISAGQVRSGLAKAVWPGRLERFKAIDKYRLYLDGAHNPDGMRALVDTLKELYPGQKIDFLVGILNNRPLGKMAAILAEVARQVILTTVPDPKTASVSELAEAFRPFPVELKLEPNPELALDLLQTSDNRITVACGSLYLIGWLRPLLLNQGE